MRTWGVRVLTCSISDWYGGDVVYYNMYCMEHRLICTQDTVQYKKVSVLL